MDLRLELVSVPVADVDRAKEFYANQVGFHVEQADQTRPRSFPPNQAWNGSAPAAQLGWSSELGSCLVLS
jgi:predicted enzyme related to lactoylglutathione lyase